MQNVLFLFPFQFIIELDGAWASFRLMFTLRKPDIMDMTTSLS